MACWSKYRARGLRSYLLGGFGVGWILYSVCLTALTLVVASAGGVWDAAGNWRVALVIFVAWHAAAQLFRLLAWWSFEREFRDYVKAKNA
jgi:uncharacterized protein (DUF697 family)